MNALAPIGLTPLAIPTWNAAVAAPILLAVADATHVQTADNIDLVQAHILAVADATHVQTADNIDLVQAHILAVAEALHAHLADNITLDTGIVAVETLIGRLFVVEYENRVVAVAPEYENRVVAVAPESRVFPIQ